MTKQAVQVKVKVLCNVPLVEFNRMESLIATQNVQDTTYLLLITVRLREYLLDYSPGHGHFTMTQTKVEVINFNRSPRVQEY